MPEALADAWIESLEGYVQRAREIRRAYGELLREAKAENELPNIDSHDLEHDESWRSFRKDSEGHCTFPAEENKGAWVRLKNVPDNSPILRLVKAMKRQNLTKVSLGLFEYKFSGEDFLQRKPLKQPEDPHTRTEKNIQNVKEAGQKLLS